MPDRRVRKKRTLALALGGGAARGLAHIGVLKALEEAGIAVDAITGTSAGAIIGALYASGLRWRQIHEKARTVSWNQLVTPTLPVMGFVKQDKFEKLISQIIGHKTFDQLDIPFRAVAADITTGREVVLESGSVAAAVRASCSIPGLFEPTALDNRLLVDGGVLNNVPADVAAGLGADVVLAVELTAKTVEAPPPKNIIDIVYYTLMLIFHSNVAKVKKYADFWVTPALDSFSFQNLKKLDELVAAGEEAMRPILPKLLKKLKMNRGAR